MQVLSDVTCRLVIYLNAVPSISQPEKYLSASQKSLVDGTDRSSRVGGRRVIALNTSTPRVCMSLFPIPLSIIAI
jgi:hypothetical protein